MKVLVTGSEGFLGKHVSVALKAKGHQVVGLDSAPTAEIIADITKVMPIMQVDAVIHLAAVASPNVCAANPELAFNVNVNGTHQVLRLALESGAKKFVFSSSAHVYGVGPKYLPTDEYHPLWLQNVYTTTKILGEQLCQLFYDNHGLSYTTLRLFNVYGPGQGTGYFVPDMIRQAANGRIHLQGPSTTKDWIYIDDVVEAFGRAVETAYVGPINIGSGIATSLGTVAKTIADDMNAVYAFTIAPNATNMRADIGRAWCVLNWTPKVDIHGGLRATLEHAKVTAVAPEPPN